jgi:hypothetical protein
MNLEEPSTPPRVSGLRKHHFPSKQEESEYPRRLLANNWCHFDGYRDSGGFCLRSGDDQRLALTVTDTLGGQSSTLSWNLGIAKDGALTVAER